MSPAAIALRDLPPGRCVWGIGDPLDPDFAWCGRRVSGRGAPYCARHAALARLQLDEPWVDDCDPHGVRAASTAPGSP